MKDTIVTALVTAAMVVVAMFVFGLVSDNQSDLGAGTRFPNGISADSTSPSAGQVRGTTLTITSTSAFTGEITATGGIDAAAEIDASEGLTQGGGWFSYTADATLTEANLLANSGLYGSATGAGQAVISLTLPATSTMTTLIATAGDCRSWWIDASDLTAATTTTIVKGTGWNLVGLDATGAGTGADVIDGAEYGKLTACRETDTDVVGYVQEYLHAD